MAEEKEFKEVEVEEVKALHSNGGIEGLFTLWKDGKTTICLFPKGADAKCYTTEDKTMFHVAQAFYSGFTDHEIRGVKLD